MDTLRRPSAPAFAPTGRGELGMTVIEFFANHSVWSILPTCQVQLLRLSIQRTGNQKGFHQHRDA